MRTLSERLAYALENADMKQIELARAIHVNRTSVNDWLSGKTKNIRGDTLLKIANVLNVDPLWLSTGRGKVEPKWPFPTLKPSDFECLPIEVITDLEDIIKLQIKKYSKDYQAKKVS